MHSALDDENLAGLARDGDAEAFGELMRRWERKVFALCYGIMGSADEAQDAVQESFSSAYKTIGTFRGDSKFSSWIHRIAVNACLTLKRKSKRRAETALENAEGFVWEPATQDRQSNPLRTLESKEVSRVVRSAVASLPEEIRIAVIMKEFQELTFQEIAESLEIPLSTAKSRVYTGMRMLREKIAKKGIR